ncbi:MAG: hypothetical protein EHM93_14385 [Bacteroidales bacterium]|nr:MAG: hypothetical protein EHM93_14385 [Bacteroidales bacterium]
MKTKLLLPNQFKKIGWCLLIPGLIFGLLTLFFELDFEFLKVHVFSIYSSGSIFGHPTFFEILKNNITDELIAILIIIGAIFVALSKEKNEDEFILKNRLDSLVWAVYINYAILLFCIIFFYDMDFLTVMMINMFTILIFFIIRFYYVLYKSKKDMSHEK